MFHQIKWPYACQSFKIYTASLNNHHSGKKKKQRVYSSELIDERNISIVGLNLTVNHSILLATMRTWISVIVKIGRFFQLEIACLWSIIPKYRIGSAGRHKNLPHRFSVKQPISNPPKFTDYKKSRIKRKIIYFLYGIALNS